MWANVSQNIYNYYQQWSVRTCNLEAIQPLYVAESIV